jgi:alkyl hydroperoxide reductase subunit AhpC
VGSSKAVWDLRRRDRTDQRGCRLIGLSANNLSDHEDWVKDINAFGAKVAPTNVQFPIVRGLSASCEFVD